MIAPQVHSPCSISQKSGAHHHLKRRKPQCKPTSGGVYPLFRRVRHRGGGCRVLGVECERQRPSASALSGRPSVREGPLHCARRWMGAIPCAVDIATARKRRDPPPFQGPVHQAEYLEAGRHGDRERGLSRRRHSGSSEFRRTV